MTSTPTHKVRLSWLPTREGYMGRAVCSCGWVTLGFYEPTAFDAQRVAWVAWKSHRG